MGTTEQGLKNAVENCLSVKAGEIVIVITSDVLQHGKMGSFLGVLG